MKNFEYAIPDSIEKTLEYLKSKSAVLKAGGIDILDLMKEELISPDRLVSIRDLNDLKFIEQDTNGSLRLGPAVTLNALAGHELLKGPYQAIVQAAGSVASHQIRNSATLAGNLCQRPRCWYFRSNEFQCSRKNGDTCFALDGENQYHAIFGNSDGCAIVHPSGMAVALMALNAHIIISGEDQDQEVPIEEFFVEPATDITRENILKDNQLIIAVVIPAGMQDYISFYHKQKEKQSYDWPLADVAVALKMEGDTCREARIVLGSAAPVPMRSPEAENVLTNKKIDKKTAQSAADAAMQKAEPLSMNAYKVPLFKTVIYRTICQTVGIDPLN